MKSLCILGSTGSIGESTLDVVRRMPSKVRVRSMTAGANGEVAFVVRPTVPQQPVHSRNDLQGIKLSRDQSGNRTHVISSSGT